MISFKDKQRWQKLAGIIPEGKQVGILYHYTSINNAIKIISNDSLNGTSGTEEEYGKLYNKTRHKDAPEEKVISFSRDKIKHNFPIGDEAEVRFDIDGDKLSYKYKIIPFQDFNYEDDESEERIYGRNISPFIQYIRYVTIYDSELIDDIEAGDLVQLLNIKNIPYEILKDTKHTLSTEKILKYGRDKKKLNEENIQFSNWRIPSINSLKQEYKIENDLKGNNFFNSEEEFLNSVKNGKIITVSPFLDQEIDYRSRTKSYEELLDLIRSYQSYPKFRNEKSLQNIYDGFKNNQPMDYPIVIQFIDGDKRIFSGNTRMDIAFQSNINPKVILIKSNQYND